MKKISLIATLLSAVLLLQNCKKDTITATTTSTAQMIATINDTTWTADTVHASVTYNSATKSKVFACSGLALNKEITISVLQNGLGNTSGFPLGTYNVGTTPDIALSYLTEQKNSLGTYVLTPQGTVGPGSGTVAITYLDSVKNLITGTFSIQSVHNNYDGTGTITSVDIAVIQQGAFNNLHYNFASN
jgi:hypothetical protein